MKYKFFLITLPNKEELLYKCSSWTGMTNIVPYIAGEYTEDTFMRPLTLFGAIKYLIKGGIYVNY